MEAEALTPRRGDTWALRRWLIDYVDIEGVATTRGVLLTRVQPNLRQVVGWCELRCAERTFSLFGVKSFTDPDSGLQYDADTWLAIHRSRSRKPSKRPDMSPQAVGRRNARKTLSKLFG